MSEPSVEAAITALDNGWCPIDGTRLRSEIEANEDGQVALLLCEADRHVWPFARFVLEHDVNYFNGEWDPQTIADKLAEYA